MLSTPFYRIYQTLMRLASYFLGIKEPKVISKAGSIKEVPRLLKENGYNNPLIVTDKGIHALNLLSPLFEALNEEEIQYSYFYNVQANPTIENVNEGKDAYRLNKCDSIVAVGGGSAIDAAKLIGALVVKPKKNVEQLRGVLKVGKALPFLIAIPSTAGTGSETTLAAVIVNEESHHKYAINDPHLIPKYAILDPTLLLGLPKHITSTTGMDALTHAVEAYIGHANTSKTKRCALEAIKLIKENLYNSYLDGKNVIYRENMQKASYLAGVAFTRAYVGYIHSIAHSLGGKYDVPHGLANAIIMPYVLDYYGSKVYSRLAKISDMLSLCDKNAKKKDKAKGFINFIRSLNRSMDIPEKFDILYSEKDVDEMIDNAFKEGNPLYPVPKEFSRDDFKNIYRQILK